MSDFSFIQQHNINNRPIQLPWADMDISKGDFLQDNYLETSMMISLFSDAPASTDELNRFNEDQLNKSRNRGWYGSSFADLEYGSKLWLLEREKRTQGTLNLAQQYCEEALQWLINDGIAKKITVECSWSFDILIIIIEVERQHDENVVKQFSYVWQNLIEGDVGPYNILWKQFSNNIQLGVYNPDTEPVDDVGYICNNGSLVKAYNAGLTFKSDTNPPFVRQCNDGESTWPPTDEAHLVGMPLTDFDETDCATVEVGDFNWTAKQYGIIGHTGSIVGGKYRSTVSDGTHSLIYYNPVLNLSTGSLETTVERLITSNFFNAVGIVVHVNTITYGVHHVSAGAGVYRLAVTKEGATQWSVLTGSTVTFIGKITWDGSDIRCYIDGTERFSEANTGSSNLIVPADVNPNIAGNISVDFSNTSVRDAAVSGNLIHRDIAGKSCTA